MPVIGFLNGVSPDGYTERLRAFRQGLKETGYVEGENATIEYRWAENQLDRLPELAAEMARRRVAVIAASGPASAFAAKEALPWLSLCCLRRDLARFAPAIPGSAQQIYVETIRLVLQAVHPPIGRRSQEGRCGFIEVHAKTASKIFPMRLDSRRQITKPVAHSRAADRHRVGRGPLSFPAPLRQGFALEPEQCRGAASPTRSSPLIGICPPTAAARSASAVASTRSSRSSPAARSSMGWSYCRSRPSEYSRSLSHGVPTPAFSAVSASWSFLPLR
jgi:hypothetical protein